jgi:hypothetical protein
MLNDLCTAIDLLNLTGIAPGGVRTVTSDPAAWRSLPRKTNSTTTNANARSKPSAPSPRTPRTRQPPPCARSSGGAFTGAG